MGVDDLQRVDLPDIDWSQPEQSLSLVYAYALSQAKDAENWYARKRRPKKVGGQLLRVTALVLAGVGALIPILSQLYQDDGGPVVQPGWASAALLLAATLVALDRYFGLSAGWTRFMAADMSIARLRHDFEFRWQESVVAADGAGDPLERLQLAHEFVRAVDQVVADETEAWTGEFQAALDDGLSELKKSP